jgi:nitrite reductase (NADH) small subunit
MANEYRLGHVNQIPPGEGRMFDYDGRPVAVFRTRDDQVFATQALCPHRAGPLADGLVDDVTVVCPLHDRIFDLRTGAGVGTDCTIATYPVRLANDGTILVAQPAQAEAAASD